MATYRPRVLQQFNYYDQATGPSGYAIKDGLVLVEGTGWVPNTVAGDGPFLSSTWPYGVLSPDIDSGVIIGWSELQ